MEGASTVLKSGFRCCLLGTISLVLFCSVRPAAADEHAQDFTLPSATDNSLIHLADHSRSRQIEDLGTGRNPLDWIKLLAVITQPSGRNAVGKKEARCFT